MAVAVDLFAGAGGLSEGARLAGIDVAWAGNHSASAVYWHGRNHPNAIHVCQDLNQADWSQLPPHDMALTAPCGTVTTLDRWAVVDGDRMRMLQPDELRMRWDGKLPRVGHFLKPPRGRIAYEIAAINDRGERDGHRLLLLTCCRWEPSQVPEGTIIHTFHWDKR